MAEPGATPAPAFKQGSGPASLPWGEATQVNDLVGMVPPPDQGDEFTPQGDAQQFLYSPTDRPKEPFSAGLPFGAGPGPEMTVDDPVQEVSKIASQALADPRAPKELKAFAQRVQQGM